MLVTFYCDAYENITYFGDIAIKLLKYMQHGGDVPGAILAKDVPAALAALRKAVSFVADSEAKSESDKANIRIDTRALPLVNLLEAAVKAKCDVMWRS